MKQNNKGLSLVELIVVVALMALLIGIGTISFNLLFGTQAKVCAQNVSAKLSETKTGCMSRYNETMTLSYKVAVNAGEPDYNPAITSDGYYSENRTSTINNAAGEVESTDSEIRKMGSSRVKILVYMDGVPFEIGGTDNNTVTIRYDRASGAFETATAMVGGNPQTGDIEKITFQSGMRTYIITMIKDTGKHTLQG